jgi:hypothetical protein
MNRVFMALGCRLEPCLIKAAPAASAGPALTARSSTLRPHSPPDPSGESTKPRAVPEGNKSAHGRKPPAE